MGLCIPIRSTGLLVYWSVGLLVYALVVGGWRLGWWLVVGCSGLVACGWWQIARRCGFAAGGYWLVAGGWVGGWWLHTLGWWFVAVLG